MSTAATTIPAPRAPSHAPAELDPAVQGLIEDERRKHSRRLRGRTLSSAVVWTIGFFTVAAALVAFVPTQRSASAVTIAALIVAYALASRIQFEVRTGYAMATQIVLVPILFLAPLTWAPFIVCAASALSRAFDVVRGRILADRLLLAPVYSWHAFGPVIVLLAAGDRPPQIDHWPVYVVALAAQFGVDLVASGGRDWYARGVPPWTQLRFMGLAFLVDAALAPIGLLASLAAFDNTWAIAAVLPLLGLLQLFANERQVRIVRSCHEDWDGTGYPDRLAGDDIPLVARIVRCCDAFSAMTTDRPYRRARPAADALAELRRCSGADFDPRVVEALAASIADAR